jgi:hypothetical protein
MFLQTIFKSFVLLFIANLYCHNPLPRHDDPLAFTINYETQKAVAAANHAGDIPSTPCDFSAFLKDGNRPKYTPRVVTSAELLASDLNSLANAKSTVAWVEKSAKACRKGLKTKAAKDALAEIVNACSMNDLSKIERAPN